METRKREEYRKQYNLEAEKTEALVHADENYEMKLPVRHAHISAR